MMVQIVSEFHVWGFRNTRSPSHDFLHTLFLEMTKLKTTRSMALVDLDITKNIPPELVSVERHSALASPLIPEIQRCTENR
jgi:hypothetical protein